MPERTLGFGDYVGFAIAGCSAVVAVMMVILWGRSFGNIDSSHLPGPGIASLDVISEDGRLMIGVYCEDDAPRGWRRRYQSRIVDLQNDPQAYFNGDFWGWGVALPHLWVACFALVPLAWWVVVFRDRHERRRRAAFGLCRHCGYDIRFSMERCPECGNRIASPPELGTPPPLPLPPVHDQQLV